MKNYNVAVKIISKNEFEVSAKNEEAAIDKIEKIVFDSEFLAMNFGNKKVHFEAVESDNQEENQCEDCEFCCPECGTCVYSEH